MSKKLILLGTLATASIGWCLHRNKKYPLAKGYGLFNKFVIKGSIINIPTVKLANKFLACENLPPLSQELVRERFKIRARDNEEIMLTIYKAKEVSEEQPCLVYYHGGGFFLKDQAYIHKNVMKYSLNAKCTVVFVHYRTSDDYPFPTPFHDCADAIDYVWNNAKHLNVDKKRIAVGGDSAGGALAASITHYCKKFKIPLCYQMLIYPVIDSTMNTNTVVKYSDGPLWNSNMSKKMWQIYLRDGVKEMNEYVSPILADDFCELPNAYIEISEFDSLFDEGKEYAKKLESHNVLVETLELKGSIHGFDILGNTDLTKYAMERRYQALLKAFHK